MKRTGILSLCLAGVAVFAMSAAACSSPAAPAPTAAPKVEPTKPAAAAAATTAPAAAAATTAPAAATKAPASAATTAWPEKGKSITMIVPFAAGGSTDIGARLLAAGMEKELGVPINVVNKGGAGSQTGLTELAKSKADGYFIGFANLPTANLVYSDPERKAAFTGKDLAPIGVQVVDPSAIGVAATSNYKSVKDLVDAAKAKPGEVKFGSDGPMTDDDLGIFQLEKASGAKFANVGFDGAAPNMAALLGGHIDASYGHVGDFVSPAKAGQVRVVGIADKEKSKFFPDVPSMIDQGFNITNSSTRTLVAPAGVPAEIVDKLAAAMKKAMDAEDHKKKMDDSGLTLRYMEPKAAAALWTEMDTLAKSLVEARRK